MKNILAFTLIALLPITSWAEENIIEIKSYKFVPEKLTVTAGTTVTWVNSDDIPHGVADKDKKFRSPAIDTHERYSFTYATPGTYPYFCTLHPYMTGEVTVTK